MNPLPLLRIGEENRADMSTDLPVSQVEKSAVPQRKFGVGKKNAKPQNEDDLSRVLKIRVNTLRRNVKDIAFAKEETARETLRLEKFTRENPEKVKQQKDVVTEAANMIPHAQNRVRQSLAELKSLLESEEVNGRIAAEHIADAVIAQAAAESALAE